MHIPTLHHPELSLLQAALHDVLQRRGDAQAANMSGTHPLMQELVATARGFTQPGRGGQLPTPSSVLTCAELAVHWVFAHGAEKQLLYDELKGSTCDPCWFQAIEAYAAFELEGGKYPYVPFDPDRSPNPPVTLSDGTVTLALLADWGMGTPVSAQVLKSAADLGAQALVHLGDIYYAGTRDECRNNFLAPVREQFPSAFSPGGFPVYAIPGNHEYYSGAVGFFEDVVPGLAQPGHSFFCIRTPQWQVVALDTGRNDDDPFTVTTNMTFLTVDQLRWLGGVMASAEGRRTILLSHHQLYSGAGTVGVQDDVRYGINPFLYQQVSAYFGSIDLWLWGHEHNTVIFEPVEGLPLGRCIGSASIPIQVDEKPYTPDPGLSGVNGLPVPAMDLSVQLGNNGTDYYHGFAMLTLSPEQAVVTYYQVPLPDAQGHQPPVETLGKPDVIPYRPG